MSFPALFRLLSLMVVGGLIILAALQATAAAEPTVRSAGKTGTYRGTHADLLRLVRSFEDSEDQSGIAPDAALELLDLARSDVDRKRLWRDVPASGAISDRHLLHMTIAAISTDKVIGAPDRPQGKQREPAGQSEERLVDDRGFIIGTRVSMERTLRLLAKATGCAPPLVSALHTCDGRRARRRLAPRPARTPPRRPAAHKSAASLVGLTAVCD